MNGDVGLSNFNRPYFGKFHGTVAEIEEMAGFGAGRRSGCYKRFTVINEEGETVNFVVKPDTYFVNHEQVSVGMNVTGFYDANVPTILIYPPQYDAVVMAVDVPGQSVKVDWFDRNLLSWDRTLKLNIADSTELLLINNQPFDGTLANRTLIVIYGASTRSIPAQTTPDQVIVMCNS